MRRISFNMTVDAVLSRSKTITRRLGWLNLKPGERLLAVDRLRSKDAKVLGVIEMVSVRREKLYDINADDVRREGFDPTANIAKPKRGRDLDALRGRLGFINAFCDAMGCAPDAEVTRIEFRYIDEAVA